MRLKVKMRKSQNYDINMKSQNYDKNQNYHRSGLIRFRASC